MTARPASRGRHNPVLWLVIAIPVLSMVMSGLTATLAFRSAEPTLEPVAVPLSKRSWKEE